ncbi:hypothetical protein ABFX02_14G312100 [Erythranthe guttata]
MALSIVRSSSSRITSPPTPGRIVIAYDASRKHNMQDFKDIIADVLTREDMVKETDTVTVFGVLDKVLHPLGFRIEIGHGSFIRAHERAFKEEVSRKVDANVDMLKHNAEECEGSGIDIKVKIVVGAPMKNIVVQEIMESNTTWAILDRKLSKESRFYLKHIPCKVAIIRDNLSLEVLRSFRIEKSTGTAKHKVYYSLSKPVLVPSAQDDESDNQSLISLSLSSLMSPCISSSNFISSSASQDKFCSNPQQELSGISAEVDKFRQIDSDTPVLVLADVIKLGLDSSGCSYSDILIATDNFSSDNLLGEGGYGVVYKGKLKDGQFIAVKLHKEENTQGVAELHSEVYRRSFARHTNIVTLLGYCCKENLKILIYEYVCNKSLEWHLFDNTEKVLDWNQRNAVAIGTAKGLRFLHEECRGSPIVHQDIRPSNILLTGDFVPLLGDYGLAKWKTNKCDEPRRTPGNLGYLAPECAENGIYSVKTDVYAFGIVLLELISGRKTRENHQQSIRLWALPLIQTLSFDELVDSRLEGSYSTYEVYNIARAAYLCVQIKPKMRPSMGEVLCLLEGSNGHLRHVKSSLYPIILTTEGQS